MAITASSVVRRATEILMDATSVRWSAGELVRHLNDAQRMIVVMRPDAITVTATPLLNVGALQDLDLLGLSVLPVKLFSINRNTAATSVKKSITLVPRFMLDAQAPGWYSTPPSVNVEHYMYDARDPKTFYVYPPATALAQVEIGYSGYPALIAEPASTLATYSDVTGNLSVPDLYEGAVLDLILYRAYSKDSEFAANAVRAQGHKSAAEAALGVEISTTLASQPQTRPGTGTPG